MDVKHALLPIITYIAPKNDDFATKLCGPPLKPHSEGG